MTSYDYLLIGGYAAAHAAHVLREHDSNGTIALFNAEEYAPYERPPLTKEALWKTKFSPEEVETLPAQWYKDAKVELRLKARVASINREKRTVTLSSGEEVGYGKLLLAPGAGAKRPDFPGANAPNVHVVRKVGDSQSLREAMQSAKRAVVIGGSYLGLETASGCLKLGIDVTVVDSHIGPWSKFASPELMAFLRGAFEKQGARFIFEEKVGQINLDAQGQAISVQSSRGALPCDLVIAATGSKQNLELAKGCGLEIDEKNGVVVNANLQSSDPYIWLAGDCACFPDSTVGRRWHIEHFRNARWQGELAGANMAKPADEQLPFERVPYFFSDVLDISMILRGDPQGGKKTRVLGDMTGGEFVELYANEEGVVKMVLAISHDKPATRKLADRLEPLIKAQRPLDVWSKADMGEFFA